MGGRAWEGGVGWVGAGGALGKRSETVGTAGVTARCERILVV